MLKLINAHLAAEGRQTPCVQGEMNSQTEVLKGAGLKQQQNPEKNPKPGLSWWLVNRALLLIHLTISNDLKVIPVVPV